MMMETQMKNKINESFSRQNFMEKLGARLISVEEGEVKIECDFQEDLTQQHGYLHAGVLASIVDSACGYAALTTMPDDADVLSVEFKINLLRPAKANKIIAIGTVFKAGKTLTICDGIVTDETEEKVLAKMTATMICIKKNN